MTKRVGVLDLGTSARSSVTAGRTAKTDSQDADAGVDRATQNTALVFLLSENVIRIFATCVGLVSECGKRGRKEQCGREKMAK